MRFTEEHTAFRATVREVVEREIAPHVDEWERAGAFPAHQLFPKLGALGLLGLEYDEAVCLDDTQEQAPIPLGTPGDEVTITSQFDGWGYVHLFDAVTGEDLDTYAIPEAMDPAFASGFGDLSVHEVAIDPNNPNLLYLSYYSGGVRMLEIQCPTTTSTAGCELVEVGAFIDEGGSNFWGVEIIDNPYENPAVEGDESLILASDRDYGLYIFTDP